MTIEMIIAIFGSVLASSGLWTFINSRGLRKSNTNKLLLGLSYFYLIDKSKIFIERGSITQSEYDYFMRYFADPYLDLGGNGLGHKLIDEIKELPIKETQ